MQLIARCPSRFTEPNVRQRYSVFHLRHVVAVAVCLIIRLPVRTIAFSPSSHLSSGIHETHYLLLPRLTIATTTSAKASRTEEFGVQRNETFYKRLNRWIVVVDDEESIRIAVGQFLSEQGYRVTACPDAQTALQVCTTTMTQQVPGKQNKEGSTVIVPDAIVSDIRMPGMDGLELLGRIRSNPMLVGVPVVLLTAKGMTSDRITGYKAGADVYLPKPFNPEELLSILDNVIERHDTLSAENIAVDDLRKDMNEIKNLVMEKTRKGAGDSGAGASTEDVFLTADERTVLEYLGEGLTNKEIAQAMNLSQRRVEQHLTSMYRKTSVVNKTELLRWAIATGNVRI